MHEPERGMPADSGSAGTSIGDQGRIFPFIDGTLLTAAPGDAFASGQFNRVPVMTGNNHDEYRYFVATQFYFNPKLGPVTAANYATDVGIAFGLNISASVQSQYPVAPDATGSVPPLQLAAAGTDGIFVCTARRAEQSLSHYVPALGLESTIRTRQYRGRPMHR